MRSEKESDATEENRRETNNSTHMHSYTLLNDISNAKHVNSHDYLFILVPRTLVFIKVFCGKRWKTRDAKIQARITQLFFCSCACLQMVWWCKGLPFDLLCFGAVYCADSSSPIMKWISIMFEARFQAITKQKTFFHAESRFHAALVP